MKKCPFCSEQIKEDAIICKHCQQDVTTTKAANLRKKREIEEELRRQEQVKQQQAAQKEKEREEYLASLSKEEKEAYLAEEDRQGAVMLLWIALGNITWITLSFLWNRSGLFFVSTALLVFIWIYPLKGQKVSDNRLKSPKKHIVRILLSICLIIANSYAFFTYVQEQKQEQFVAAYPVPQIEVLSSKEHQGDASKYQLELAVSDAEIVKINNREVTPKDGKITYMMPLTNTSNEINISAQNEYKNENVSFIIERFENEEEKKYREEQEAAEKRERAEWERSAAGKLCLKYPHWSKNDCVRIADNRIWIGMTYEMLVELRGKPNSANPSDYGYGTQWQWCWFRYDPSCFYDDNDDGIIDSYN